MGNLLNGESLKAGLDRNIDQSTKISFIHALKIYKVL